MSYKRSLLPICLFLFLLLPALPAQSQLVQDITLRYEGMYISEAMFQTSTRADVDFFRHLFEVSAGRGPLTLGVLIQTTQPGEVVPAGTEAETGVMLTAAYGQRIGQRFRMEARGRLGVTGTNEAQPLYAEDTDFSLNFVTYSLRGAWLMGQHPVFPSAYIGGIVNRYGRVQGVAGTGLWWRGLSIYGTVFQAINGVANPLTEIEDADVLFAKIQNGGISLSGSYELKRFQVQLKRNWALQNGGNDLALALQYRLK